MAKIQFSDEEIIRAGKNDSRESWDTAEYRKLLSRGVLTTMPIASLRVNPNNPRDTDWQKNCTDLANHIAAVGYDKSQPLTVEVFDDGTGMAWRGNRRLTAILSLRDSPDETLRALYAEFFPDGTIPVLQFSNLTPMERNTLIVDHGKGFRRKELTVWEYFLAVKLFVAAGTLSTADIGKHFGYSRSWAQKLVALAKMPKAVQEAFRPVLLNNLKETNLRSGDILFVARDYNNLSREAFAVEWAKWVDGTAPDSEYAKSQKSGVAPRIESINLKELRDQFNSADSPLATVAESATGIKDFTSRLMEKVAALASEVSVLHAIRDMLGATEYASLVKRAQTAAPADPAATGKSRKSRS